MPNPTPDAETAPAESFRVDRLMAHFVTQLGVTVIAGVLLATAASIIAIIVFVFFGLTSMSVQAQAQAPKETPISGMAYVRDGDGIHIGEVKFRMWGIDAPELDQTCRTAQGDIVACGEISRAALEELIGNTPVTCYPDGMTYDRLLAVCRRSDGADLSAAMVRLGFAFAYREYSLDYAAHEEQARIEGRYLWQLEVVSPADWRKLKKAEKRNHWSMPKPKANPSAGASSPAIVKPAIVKPAGSGYGQTRETPSCRIKGNINREGRKLYHRPGTSAYAKTKLSPENGEAWFCSAEEAEAAGFAAARR